MLSRIAESLFWIGRYVERADDTARILDVQMQLLVEDPGIDEGEACLRLLSVMGVDADGRQPTRALLLDVLGTDPTSETALVASIAAARESARRARETLSTEMWEAINTTWRAIPSGRTSTMRPPQLFAWAKERAAVIAGIADSTMSRDDGWHFLVLGRSIERVDMTARLLSTAALSHGPKVAWPTTLRACGAYEAFVRTYRGMEADREAAEFLLLDRLFPRSVVGALNRAEESLQNLESSGRRSGFSTEAIRLLGRARTELEYRPLGDVMFDLPTEMERLQRTCSVATDAISQRYFATVGSVSWMGGLA
ncbi:putative alpha-E superfamily protein [Mumia flava]|uniref:Putative alpha-E superfamily protein n=1 Tax=Mumia flava TaxID=1348852 RepID=A0A0B2B6I9_9ACTN|nr:alpha-E domain-containing protein [Mumia flava]PJJ57677.1 putative alpha-E superfamily protein [Mumia flava]